jgi:hypothetical protein
VNVYEILVEQSEDRDHLEGVHVDGRIMLKLIQECKLKPGVLKFKRKFRRQGVKGGGEFLDKLSDYQLLQKVSPPRRPKVRL